MPNLTLISETYTKLVGNADQNRLSFSGTALTIYTALSSGLFLLSTNLLFNNMTEKLSFFIVVITSVLIVLFSLTERYAYFLIANNIGDFYTKKVRETGEHFSGQMGGTSIQTKLASVPVHFIMLFIFINLVSSVIFIYSRIFL